MANALLSTILLNLILLTTRICSKQQKDLPPASEMLSVQTRLLAHLLASILDDDEDGDIGISPENSDAPDDGSSFSTVSRDRQLLILRNNHTSFVKWLNSSQFTASIGISVDPDGKADTKNSMVYLWRTPSMQLLYGSRSQLNGDGKIFTNATALFSRGEGGQEGQTGPLPLNQRSKRAPKGGGGGGGRGGGGGGRGGGSGRSSSSGRGASSRSSKAGLSGARGSGIGAARPHVWMFINTNMPYRWSDDEEYDWKADTASDAVRMEISLCFGRHKSRESCSAKVDAMLEKWALEKRGSPLFPWIVAAVFGIILLFGCGLAIAGKMAEDS